MFAAPPSAIMSPRSERVEPGGRVEFRCDVTGSPRPRVHWSKEEGELPLRHSITRNTLTSVTATTVYDISNIHGVSKNCAKLFLSELRQISTNLDNFWQKDGKEAEIMRVALIFYLTYFALSHYYRVKRRCSKLLHNAESCYLQ